MVVAKDTEAKISAAKRNIKIEDVSIRNDQLVDEEGNIVGRLQENLPEGVDTFTIKISIELPEDEEDE